MPNLNEFLNKPESEPVLMDDGVELIKQMRPCSHCDMFVDEYYFNANSMEMYWTCINGHKTTHRIG